MMLGEWSYRLSVVVAKELGQHQKHQGTSKKVMRMQIAGFGRVASLIPGLAVVRRCGQTEKGEGGDQETREASRWRKT